MSKKQTTFLSSAEAVEKFQLNLKNRALAALLAWLVPGLGHLYQGRHAKGALFMICIMSLMVFGIYVGQGYGQTSEGDAMINAVNTPMGFFNPTWDFESNKQKARFIAQAGVGAVALPSLIQQHRMAGSKQEKSLGPFSPARLRGANFTSTDYINGQAIGTVRHPNELAKWNYDGGFYFELGIIYTVVAGLLNVLVIYDAACGPLIVVHGSQPESEPETPANKN